VNWSDRIRNEANQLLRLKRILDSDTKLSVRMDIERSGLTFSSFLLRIRGVEGLIAAPGTGSGWKTSTFKVDVTLPSGYPDHKGPGLTIHPPVPFHPHVWPGGSFCLGDLDGPHPDMTLVDWFYAMVEFFNWSEGLIEARDIGANRDAKLWWDAHKGQAARRYLAPVDFARLRFFVDTLKVT
jgi:ubiquitin-protein ligase